MTIEILLGLRPSLIAGGLSPRRSLLTVLFCAMLAGPLAAQTFTSLYSFRAYDGYNPRGDLALSGSTLYGTTIWGGSSWGSGSLGWGYGTVFAIDTDGTGFQTIYNFTSGLDGARPNAGVMISGNTLFGTSEDGGNPGGTVFSINGDGNGFTALYDFSTPNVRTNDDGAGPDDGLILSGNTLYGVTPSGGPWGHGVAFRINKDGTGFAALHDFTATDGNPLSDLVLSGNTLYGVTFNGGPSGSGSVYALSTDGAGFTNLYSFTGDPVNADGASPNGLVMSGTTLYGTASGGGASGYGTVFALETNGTGFRTLHTFTAPGASLPGQGGYGTNSDGLMPDSGLVLSGDVLYAVTHAGGPSGSGTVFSLKTDGTGFTTLHNFSLTSPIPCPCHNTDGSRPGSRLLLSGNTLYGTTLGGGAFGYGTVFSIVLPVGPPTLDIRSVEGNVILTWSTNAAGFTLQSTGDLITWTNLAAPVLVNGLNTFTNPVSGAQQFYRLIH